MSKSPDFQSEASSGDPRLQEFLRRASPILAAERGWNERSRLKIKSLADDLNLPQELYDLAVTLLKKGELLFEDRFTTYERAFLKHLHRQFTKSGESVLTAADETRAIKLARRDFEIPQIRARQLVRRIAEQLGMSRVSKLDAVEYVANVVDELVGDATVVPDNTRQRIAEAGKKWGVEANQVEILIRNRIEANRPTRPSPAPWKIRFLAATASLLLMLALVWISQWMLGGEWYGAPRENTPPTDPSGSSVPPPDTPSWPVWWSTETKNQFADFTADHRAVRFPHPLLLADQEGDRLTGYQAIVDLIRLDGGEFSQRCVQLFAQFYQDESASVCRQMGDILIQLGPSGDRLPSNIRGFAKTWQAVDLLNACLERPLPENKLTLLDDVTRKLAGVSVRQPDFSDQMRAAVIQQQWRLLKSRSQDEPERAANLIDGLGDLTRQQSSLANPAEYAAVVNLLTIRPGVWNAMRQSLERALETADEDQQRYLYLLENNSGIPEFQAWLGTRLAERRGIAAQRLTALRLDEALQVSLSLNSGQGRGMQPRWRQLMENRQVQRLLRESPAATPQTIGEAVHFATIAMLLWQSEKTGDPGLVARADELLQSGPRLLTVRSRPSSADYPVYRRIQRRALPSDIRVLEDSLQKLSDPQAFTDQTLATAWERLSRSAPRIRDLSWDQAQSLARYMLEANATSEVVAIEQYGSQMRHWVNLCLALADQVMETDGRIDQALTCSSILLGFQPSADPQEWRPALRDQILQHVAGGLRHTAEVQGFDSRFQWNELRNLLMDHYRIRCHLLRVPGARSSAAVSPAELAELLVRYWPGQESGEQVDARISSNRYVARNEMQLLALHGGSLLDGMADPDNPAQKGEAQKGDARFAAPTDLPQSLLANELRLLVDLTGSDP